MEALQPLMLDSSAVVYKEEMKCSVSNLTPPAALIALLLMAAMPAPSPAQPKKNWTPPNYKIQAQVLSDEIMAKHPELISVTFHGVPPGLDKVYTMFAGSFPERIGNSDDPDDIDVTVKGITIVDPRWRRNDPIRKFVIMMPLREVGGENVGLIVFAFKHPVEDKKSEIEYLTLASKMRDALKPRIPNYKSLFEKAK